MQSQRGFLAGAGLMMLLSMGACASGTGPGTPTTPAPPAVRLEVGTPTTLSAGANALLPDGSRLTYQGIVNDSRCKPGVQCVWAGDAEARFTHTTRAGTSEIFSIHTELQPRTKTLGATTLHLRGVDWQTPPAVTIELK